MSKNDVGEADRMNCALVYDCYLSGQIDEVDWQARLREDERLRRYIEEQEA